MYYKDFSSVQYYRTINNSNVLMTIDTANNP